jgi:RNA polymerase sigma factor (sigma-70 family)
MTNRLTTILAHSVREGACAEEASDRELVERFAGRGDAGSFAALVRRHGAMVLGVCRRVLRHEQDAEDVFQATFLVLSRKAGGLRQKEAVGPWLFGVARRLALRARQRGQNRPGPEPHSAPPVSDPLEDLTIREARAVLDEELARLPPRERGPLVLCYLEGLTRDEAAHRLGCPLGTLKSRLERGRAILERRLTRRGLGLAAVLPAVALTRDPVSAMSSTLQRAAVEAALTFAGRSAERVVISPRVSALAEGMMQPALAGKFAAAAAILLAVVAGGLGASLIAPTSGPPYQPEPRSDAGAARLERGTDRTADRTGVVKRPPRATPAAPPVTEPPTAPGGSTDRTMAEKIEPEPLPATVNGVAKAVDAERGTLTVAHRDGEDTFSLTNDARVEIDGAPGELSKLPTGANVSLTRFVGPKTAGSVQASGRSYFGNLVRAVDVPNRTITIRDKPTDSTFVVAPNALIWIDGKAAKLDAVPPGAFVNLGLVADQRTVRSIGADGPCLGGCGGSLVEAVDARKRTITFDKKASPDVAGKTFAIAPDALVTINGNRTGTLSDVPVGCFVGLGLRVDGKTVGRVHALGPSNLCDPGGSVVKAVDAESGTITFDDGANPEVAGRTFALAKDVNVIIDGKSGKLSAIPPGTLVEMRLWVDWRTVGEVCTCGHPVPGVGVATAVDAARHTITVGQATYPVARDANIVIDGKSARLADVPVGISVALKWNVDRKTVGTIFQVRP